MKNHVILPVTAFILLAQTAQAYVPNMGGSGGGGACAKPKFSHFTPAVNSEMPPSSAFSFMASPSTHPNSVKVSVKGIPVAVTTSPKIENAFKVSGHLPSSLKNTFARINIVGESSGRCKGTDGWLIKITE